MAPGIQKKAMFKHIRQVDISLLFIYTLLYFFFLKRDMKSMILSSFVELGRDRTQELACGRQVSYQEPVPPTLSASISNSFSCENRKGDPL